MQTRCVAVHDKELTAAYNMHKSFADVSDELRAVLVAGGFILIGDKFTGKVTAVRNDCAGVTFYKQETEACQYE